VSIAFDILSALAQCPDGEAPVTRIKDRLVEDALSPRRLAAVHEKRLDPLHHHRLRDPESLQNLFSSGLVERPRPGVWKLTAKGRAHLADFSAPASPRER
jgi:hypothetical protein